MLGGHLNSTLLAMGSSHNASGPGNACLHGQPVVREDLDVVSVRFRILGDFTVPVQSGIPTLLLLNLNSGMDSGGNLVLNLMLNQVRMNPCCVEDQGSTGFASCQNSEVGSILSLQTSVGLGNATVLACLSPTSPALSLNDSWGCWTGTWPAELLANSLGDCTSPFLEYPVCLLPIM